MTLRGFRRHALLILPLLAAVFVFASESAAQQLSFSGTVRDANGVVPGATVTLASAGSQDFLSKANPNWPRATLLEMMNTHLSTTAAELVARLSKDWDGDVKAFDAVYNHILHMADALSDGIIKQFPEKFGGGATSTTGR